MENQAVSGAHSRSDRERAALLNRVEELARQVAQEKEAAAVAVRDREDLLSTYRVACTERQTLERSIASLGEQRDGLARQVEEQRTTEAYLRSQLATAATEAERARIDLNARERQVSEMARANESLADRLEQRTGGEKAQANRAEMARSATAAMAADAETLRYDNARLLHLADSARGRIEELEHRLRVTTAQLDDAGRQIVNLEAMVGSERNERARLSSQLASASVERDDSGGGNSSFAANSSTPGKGESDERQIRELRETSTRLTIALQHERARAMKLEEQLRSSQEMLRGSQTAAARFQQIAVKYEQDLGEHETAIEKLERSSRISSSGTEEEEE